MRADGASRSAAQRRGSTAAHLEEREEAGRDSSGDGPVALRMRWSAQGVGERQVAFGACACAGKGGAAGPAAVSQRTSLRAQRASVRAASFSRPSRHLRPAPLVDGALIVRRSSAGLLGQAQHAFDKYIFSPMR